MRCQLLLLSLHTEHKHITHTAMVHTKRVTDLQAIYQITAEDVFFAFLVACGAGRSEAFATIYKPLTSNPSSIARAAAQLTKTKQGIEKLIMSLETINGITAPEIQKKNGIQKEIKIPQNKKLKRGEEQESIEVGGEFNDKYRTKEEVLNELANIVPLLRGKERADVLLKIADLQQMKKEENEEDSEQVVYFHPVSCYKCELFKKKS